MRTTLIPSCAVMINMPDAQKVVPKRVHSMWKPETPNTIEGLYGNLPSVDKIFFRFVNQTKTRQISVYMNTNEIEQFAKDLLKTVKKVRAVQNKRGALKYG